MLAEKDFDTIFYEYEKFVINQLCESEMLLRFREMCAYYSVYSDKKFSTRLFNSFEEFSNLISGIKDQILDTYAKLEVGGEELKKLPGVMQ